MYTCSSLLSVCVLAWGNLWFCFLTHWYVHMTHLLIELFSCTANMVTPSVCPIGWVCELTVFINLLLYFPLAPIGMIHVIYVSKKYSHSCCIRNMEYTESYCNIWKNKQIVDDNWIIKSFNLITPSPQTTVDWQIITMVLISLCSRFNISTRS